MDLHVVHIPKLGIKNSLGRSLNECGLGPLVFETCLRQIAVLDSDLFLTHSEYKNFAAQNPGSVEIFKGEHAYQFVLEVICGLHSLIKGETEIFGQFKDFTVQSKTVIENLNMTDLFKQLLTDCKILRSTRIQNWSHNTYGSVTRKLLTAKDGVALLGAGQLAEEIAPWLKQVKNKSVLLRRPRNLAAPFDSFQVEMTDRLNASQEITVLVVAANVTNTEIESFVNHWPNLRMVVDWRGDEQWLPKKTEQVFLLHDLKANDEKSKEDQQMRIQLVSEDIQVKALEFSKKAKHNPWGWEDFCA
ncbi:MAG: hypothetical protein B7Y39_12600 [Bdellovibrio sp. 28-41-41]|nr:MAG: hypothetical protein B7Y39_12600 [Bdellovibrio sp. 28-41-41]